MRKKRTLTSIQKLGRIKFETAYELAEYYFSWLTTFFFYLVITKKSKEGVTLFLFGIFPLLILEAKGREESKVTYQVCSGLLVSSSIQNARFEFEVIDKGMLGKTALYDFKPSLPWFLYKYTQAPLHEFVMRRFKAHVEV